jgi:hypothetical protein
VGGEVGRQDLDGGATGSELLGEFIEPVRAAGHQDEVAVVGQ